MKQHLRFIPPSEKSRERFFFGLENGICSIQVYISSRFASDSNSTLIFLFHLVKYGSLSYIEIYECHRYIRITFCQLANFFQVDIIYIYCECNFIGVPFCSHFDLGTVLMTNITCATLHQIKQRLPN